MQARGDAGATVQEMPKFSHLSNLMSATYDRGSKVVGMIEQRMGEAAFIDFLHVVYNKYSYQVLRVADFQKELEAYTGRSWDDFFQGWLYGSKRTDWAVQRVEVDGSRPSVFHKKKSGEVEVCVWLQQRGEMSEPTVLGFRLAGQKGYQLRVPVSEVSEPTDIPETGARIEPDGEVGWTKSYRCYKVTITLPCEPEQISVDPDCILLDCNPTNNYWKPEVRWRLTPLYTQLEEVDVTNSFDRWNVIFGPWFYANAYNDPWFIRSPLIGMKAGSIALRRSTPGRSSAIAPTTPTSSQVVSFTGTISPGPAPRSLHLRAQSAYDWAGADPRGSRRALRSLRPDLRQQPVSAAVRIRGDVRHGRQSQLAGAA